MSGMLKVGHAALDDASAGLRSAAAGIEATLDDLARRRWDAAMRDMEEVLHAIGLAVASANDQYRSAESANARRFGG